MKKTIFSLILLTSIFTMQSRAEGVVPENPEGNTDIYQVFVHSIRSSIVYPEFAKEQKIEGFVLISFAYSFDGSLVVNQCNTSCRDLADYVIEQLSQIGGYYYMTSPETVFNMRFEFSLI